MSPWKIYKRRHDGKVVEARVVLIGGDKVMESRIPGGGKGTCPHCWAKLNVQHDESNLTALGSPETFHQAHKPYRKPAPKSDD